MQRWGLAAIQFSLCSPEASQCNINRDSSASGTWLRRLSTHAHTRDCQTFSQKASLAFFFFLSFFVLSFPRATESWDVARGERGAAVSEWTPVSCSARKFQSGYTGAARASEGSDSLQLPLRYSKLCLSFRTTPRRCVQQHPRWKDRGARPLITATKKNKK